jgi:hypothetical protein
VGGIGCFAQNVQKFPKACVWQLDSLKGDRVVSSLVVGGRVSQEIDEPPNGETRSDVIFLLSDEVLVLRRRGIWNYMRIFRGWCLREFAVLILSFIRVFLAIYNYPLRFIIG